MKKLLVLILVCVGCLELQAASPKRDTVAMIFRARIEYPLEARKRRMEGAGTYRLDVDNRGYVTAVRVGASSGHKLLDQAAIEGLLKCRFKAGTRPLVRIPVYWKLPGSGVLVILTVTRVLVGRFQLGKGPPLTRILRAQMFCGGPGQPRAACPEPSETVPPETRDTEDLGGLAGITTV